MTRVDTKIATVQLLDRVEQGGQMAITHNGKVAVDPMAGVPSRRAAFYGAWKGQVDMSRFDEADEEIAREFGMLD